MTHRYRYVLYGAETGEGSVADGRPDASSECWMKIYTWILEKSTDTTTYD